MTFVAGILVSAMIAGLFQPSGLEITYTDESYFQVRKLFLAAGVLAVLAFMLMLSMAIYMNLSSTSPINPAGKDIFDSMVKVVPPIMTLVLGFYFGQQSVIKSAAESTKEGTTQAAKGQVAADAASSAKQGDRASSPKLAPATSAASSQTGGASVLIK